ncbi:hypothetical protein [Allopusillimonas ginsengisoli]|uniref:hypothetical protein n=1 Tax=Allopusillimonas ginsengisoli TaxID=453575 RepID=UPI0010216F73|nr:hypothetical protein [Allopusillimonas ginsengisoli]TEA78666.1 hypothetical protein ERE07_09735 [Allopusillimonas ginsengisoli]
MEIIIFWVLASIAIGVWAGNKGRSGFAWFILAVLISPILAAIFLAASSDLSKNPVAALEAPSPKTHVTCPDCAEMVKKEARVCKHCGCKLTPVVEAPVPTVGGTGLTGRQIIGIVLALLLAYGIFSGR